MSIEINIVEDAEEHGGSCSAIELVINPREHDLGGFSVRRALPCSGRRMVGPWIFFDHMGPALFPPGQGIDVRPHPHINLATVTYLFEGEMLPHRHIWWNFVSSRRERIEQAKRDWQSGAFAKVPGDEK